MAVWGVLVCTLCRVWGWWGQSDLSLDKYCGVTRRTFVACEGIRDRVNQSGQVLQCDKVDRKLQALVYDILPSTTAVFSHAIGSRKLSANEQFFVGAQTVVRLLQTTQIKQGVSVIAANKVYTSANKTTIVWIETELSSFFTHVYVRAWALGCFHNLISTQTFRRTLTASVDSCTEIKSAPSVA